MEQLIQLILDNLFIIILIVSGLIGLLGKIGSNDEKEKRPQSTQSRPGSAPSRSQRNTRERYSERQPAENASSRSTLAEQHREQMEQLAGKLNTETKEALDDLSSDIGDQNILREPAPELTEKQEEFRGKIKRNLNREGLINGIIMSEVLGPPRAKRSYRREAAERRR
ncbi:hypothetical protein [Lentibacillus sediminis]|uniref:hypothetical protein n=1 Tax=Lentibacillus sediminis TaxID=1940529 RepID=UPI000C1BC34D|nr:hypothetical protein [Lentibacillus sediminis]